MPGFPRWVWHPWLGLGLLMLLHGLANLVWVQHDMTLRSTDMSPHLESQLHVYSVIRNHGLGGVLRVVSLPSYSLWPATGYLPGAIHALIFGHSIPALRMLMFVHLAILMVCVYRIGTLLRSRSVGLWAAALVSFYPLVYGEGRQFSADFPGMVVTAFNVLMLLSTRRYGSSAGSLLFGVCLGLGVFIRPHSLLVLGWPAAALAVAAMIRPTVARWRVLLNVGLALAAAVLVSSRWWWGRTGEIFGSFFHHYEREGGAHEHGLSSAFYFKALPICFGWVLVGAMVLAGVLLLWTGCSALRRQRATAAQRGDWEGMLVLCAWLLGGAAVLSSLGVSHLRYLLPLCPVLALLTVAGLQQLPHGLVRRLATGLVMGVAVLAWGADSSGLVNFQRRQALFSQGLPPEVSVASGPPRADPIVVVADRVSAVIARRHRHGLGLYVRLLQEDANGWTAHRAAMGPVVCAKLPGAFVTAEKYEDLMPHLAWTTDIGAANIPLTCALFRHHYLVRFKDSRVATSAPDNRPHADAEVLFDGAVRDPGSRAVIVRRVVVWYWSIPMKQRRSPCP